MEGLQFIRIVDMICQNGATVEGRRLRTLKSFDGPVWRLLPEAHIHTPEKPAGAPEGRFHHSGQTTAAYASLSAEGARVAIKRYIGDGVARKLILSL